MQRQQAQPYGQQSDNRRAAIAETLAQRETPLNEIIALMSGSQVTTPFSMPGFNGNTSVAPPPIFGATTEAGNYATDAYNARVGNRNSQNQAAGQIAGAGIAAMFF